mgnify:CR=1 FL=1
MGSNCASRSRRLSLETAKFLGVPFVICSPYSTAVWRYVHREDGTVLQISPMSEVYWEDTFIDDEKMKRAEKKYGLELYEPHEEESR